MTTETEVKNQPFEMVLPAIEVLVNMFHFTAFGPDPTLPLRLMLNGLLSGLSAAGVVPYCDIRVIPPVKIFGSVTVHFVFGDGTRGVLHIKQPNSDLPPDLESVQDEVVKSATRKHGPLRLVVSEPDEEA